MSASHTSTKNTKNMAGSSMVGRRFTLVWKDGDMRLRWASAGMLAAASQFRRVKGHTQLPALAAALQRATIGESNPNDTETVSA